MKKKSHISLVIIIISLSLYCCYHIYYYFLDKGSNDLIRDYYQSSVPLIDQEPIVKKMDNEIKEEYLGILKIPKINLQTGFYNINSKKNNVNESVTILKESTMPNNNGSIIYLTAHSGYGYLAFFKDLDKLELDDLIMIDINNNSYQYIVSDIYEMDKTGKIIVNHNIHENYLVLSTCSNNKDKQLVVVGKLIKNI